MKKIVESYVWHDAKKHKPPTFGQYLVADDRVEEGLMFVAEWDFVLHPDPKHGYWNAPREYDAYTITHWAEIAPPIINEKFQWTNIQDPVYIEAPSPSKSSSQKPSLNTSTP